MNPELQTYAALVVVATAAGWLVWRWLVARRSGGGCGSGECGAISPDVRRLKKKFR